jgi:hypothetical protein
MNRRQGYRRQSQAFEQRIQVVKKKMGIFEKTQPSDVQNQSQDEPN